MYCFPYLGMFQMSQWQVEGDNKTPNADINANPNCMGAEHWGKNITLI